MQAAKSDLTAVHYIDLIESGNRIASANPKIFISDIEMESIDKEF